MPELELTSTSFEEGDPIPQKHSCEGEDVSPPLSWRSVPEGTQTLALILHDPDAPSGDFTHWVAWNLDPGPGELGEGVPPPSEGSNGRGEATYMGPCPPPGDGPHRYVHELFALDTALELERGATRDQLEDEIEGHVLGAAELIGVYERT